MNPGALGLANSLSIFADVTLGFLSPYDNGSPVQQYSFGLNSHFLALAYQNDRLPDALGTGTIRGHAVRVVLWGRHEKVGGGGAVTWYTGGDGGVAFDAGVVYRAHRLMDLGAVLANVGQPSVRGFDLLLRLTPAVTLHTGNGAFALQAQADLDTEGLDGLAFGTAIKLGFVHVTARLDTNGEVQRESFTFGLSLGGLSRGETLVTAGGDLSQIDAASLHFTSERSTLPSRPRR